MNERNQCYDDIIGSLTRLKELDKTNEDRLKNLEYKYNQLINGLEKLVTDLKYN